LAQRSWWTRGKLAAIDITFLGSKFIVAEFVGGVLLCLALGAFILLRAGSFWQFALGLYFVSLGINYVPMLIYALSITRSKSARAELGNELVDKTGGHVQILANRYFSWFRFAGWHSWPWPDQLAGTGRVQVGELAGRSPWCRHCFSDSNGNGSHGKPFECPAGTITAK
jgi:hypothetical protein